MFYETANGPGSIVLSAEHAATLDLRRAEHEELLIHLSQL
jgi:hypothetical protein